MRETDEDITRTKLIIWGRRGEERKAERRVNMNNT